jgi:hypothetical protein
VTPYRDSPPRGAGGSGTPLLPWRYVVSWQNLVLSAGMLLLALFGGAPRGWTIAMAFSPFLGSAIAVWWLRRWWPR